MRHPAYFRLSELPTAPSNQIGSWGVALGKLVRQQIPISATCVISSSTLWQIAEANQLLAKIHQTSDVQAQKRCITSQFIPPDIARDLLKAVHQELLNQKIRLTASWLTPANEHHNLTTTTQGDANCIESLLELWAEAFVLQSSSSPKSLVPATFAFQIELAAEVKGYCLTRDPEETKHSICLRLHQSDGAKILFDVRTWNLLAKPDHTHFQKLPLSAWRTLAQHLQTIRLWSLSNYQIEWQIYHEQVVITGWHKVVTETDHPALASSVKYHRSVRGQPVIPGKIVGTVIVDPRQARPKTVLVTQKLETLPIGFSTIISAVVVENHVSQSALALLQKYHVPVIIKATGARSCFRFGDRVLVDATTGIVSRAPQVEPLKQRVTSVPLYISANQAFDQQPVHQPASGVLFRPEITLTSTGNHPHHLIRGSGRSSLFRQLTSTLASYRQLDQPLLYRLTTFTTEQLRSLRYGQMYEPVESNPRLGFYGAIRNLSNSELLAFELAAVTRVAPMFSKSLGIVIGGCRNPQELSSMTKLISKHTSQQLHTQYWWEVDTPEHIFNAEAYLQQPIKGVIINLQSLFSLCLGIDPTNQDVYHRYTWNEPLIASWIDQLAQQLGDKPLMLYIMEDQPELFRLIKRFKFAGVIVKPHLANVAQNYLEEYGST